MTALRFELGSSGHRATMWISPYLHELELAAAVLAPGLYWVVAVGRESRQDWGTLEVRDDGTWCARSLGGLQVGATYSARIGKAVSKCPGIEMGSNRV